MRAHIQIYVNTYIFIKFQMLILKGHEEGMYPAPDIGSMLLSRKLKENLINSLLLRDLKNIGFSFVDYDWLLYEFF